MIDKKDYFSVPVNCNNFMVNHGDRIKKTSHQIPYIFGLDLKYCFCNLTIFKPVCYYFVTKFRKDKMAWQHPEKGKQAYEANTNQES